MRCVRVFVQSVAVVVAVHLAGPFCGGADEVTTPSASRFEVTSPPPELRLSEFYEKYVSADGYPVVSSGRVSDYALKEAAYLINMMLAERPDLRRVMIANGSRMTVMAWNEFTTDVPEHSHMRPQNYWDARARGLGGSERDPVCSSAEENLLAYEGDPYSTENILIHEFAHNIHLRGVVRLDTTFDQRLKDTYNKAMQAGLWKGKYASVNHSEYFAEGVQSWFNNNRPPDHDHNHVDTREELKEYDSGLAAICEEVFGETELVYSKPASRLSGHLEGYDPAAAPRFVWPERLKEAQREIREKARKRSDGAASLPARPNVVVIMADDLGWTDLHCQGNAGLDTPFIDRLATEGMRFTAAYSAAPVCTPTRAAMLTGQSPARLAITNHAPGNGAGFRPEGSNLQAAAWTTYLDLSHVTLAERLQAAGYATGFFGKWHLSHKPGRDEEGPFEPRLRPEFQGFDVNVGGCSYGGPPSYFEPYRIPTIEPRTDGDYLPERLADESIRFVTANRTRPFFLCLWNYSVHYPFEAPPHLIDKYKDRVGPGINNPTYAAMIEGMDTAIGRVLQSLDDAGVRENTLVMFTSDNGAFAADLRPLRGEKGYLYEGGIRVPWIVRWPGKVEPGTICDVPIITTDTYPTVLEAVGLEPDTDKVIDGESLIPLLTQTGSLSRTAIHFHYPNYAFHRKNRPGSAIRTGDYKLIKRYDDDSIELYNVTDDIGEQRNLARTTPAIAADLQSRLEQWLTETGANMPVRVTDSP